MKKEIILTDGSEIIDSMLATEEELEELNRKAIIATDGNWFWRHK